MNAGRIEQGGTQLELYMRPSTPFVAEFLGSNNCLRGVVTESRDQTDAGVMICVQVGSHTFTSPSAHAIERGHPCSRTCAGNVSVLPAGGNGRATCWTG